MYGTATVVHELTGNQSYIGDRVAVPPQLAVSGFREHMIYMPHSYQVLIVTSVTQ